MPIPKSKRRESQFEVFHHFTQMRKKITDLLLRDFGYSYEKFNKNIEKRYGGKTYEELDDTQKADYFRKRKRNEAFDEWFAVQERDLIIECMHSLNEHIYVANSIYPYRLIQELQYAIETLPVYVLFFRLKAGKEKYV